MSLHRALFVAACAVTVQAAVVAAPAQAAWKPCQQALVSLTASPSTVVSGDPITGQVTLACKAARTGVVVALSADAALVAPSAVQVAAGTQTASFKIVAGDVAAPVTATVTGSYAGVSKGAAVTVNPRPTQPGGIAVSTLALSRTQLVGGGEPFTAKVTLTRAASVDTTVYFYGSAYGPVQLTPTVTIPAGQTDATVSLQAGQVPSDYDYTLTAEVRGTVPVAAHVRITPGPFTVWLSTTTIARGSRATGTISLNGGALATDTVVSLTTTVSGVTVPATVTIPAGATSVSFPVVAGSGSFAVGYLRASADEVDKYLYFVSY